jgi:predicted nucleic acid-binding protein
MSYLMDTDWAIHVLDGQARATATMVRLAGQRVRIGWVTLAEVYEGAFRSSNPGAFLAIFRGFLTSYEVIRLSDAIAERFGELRAFLRRRGELISDFDIVIAATALHLDLTLLTFNQRHYQRIPDLKLYQPA